VYVADGLARQAARLAVEATVVQEVGVEPIEHPGVDRLEPDPAEMRDHMKPEVALVGRPRRLLDRHLDRRHPVVGEELGEALARRRHVGALPACDPKFVEGGLGFSLGLEARAARTSSLASNGTRHHSTTRPCSSWTRPRWSAPAWINSSSFIDSRRSEVSG
jgi:hypothetical protein